ncbi:MAG: hypothetical protein ABGX16_22850 [Pirellulales bacterium]
MNPTATEVAKLTHQESTVVGSFVSIDGQEFYQINNYDQMPPFLMSIVSAGDHWMYVSSSGGLTAGRVSAENCLFPYITVDQLHDCHQHTGSVTAIRCQQKTADVAIWHPFSNGVTGTSVGPRRLLKHVAGNQVVFEETNERLGLTFRYSWRTSTPFGFVRTATLENVGTHDIEVDFIDGIQNICPSGVPLATSQRVSCLVDAYKHNEYDPLTGMGIYSLTAQILDRAEAAEILKATTVWCHGLPDSVVFLSSEALHAFCQGATPTQDVSSNGQRGNYFAFASIKLAPGETRTWYMVADVGRSHQQVARIRKQLLDHVPITNALEETIHIDHQDLLRNVASADGLQATGSQVATTHHFANVLFNNMRGGIPAANYLVESRDFLDFVATRNRPIEITEQTFLRALPKWIEYTKLLQMTHEQGHTDLVRLAMEYLPFTFSRRHGDPSRPWNEFEIKVRNDNGSKIYNYQGNWRDIFQNWEALSSSFPVFLPSIVAKFVNASTIDGFNPYRITRNGIDWEVPNLEDPWSDIGYWGDHQIAYLTKLLEAMHNYFPGKMKQLFESQIFCYANVPYRVKSYDELVANHDETIEYDRFSAKEIDRLVDDLGADGKLVFDTNGKVYYVNLIEKLLVSVLSKLSNFAVDGGIWLNTQRPEWNDANNALVGSGLSMVTVCYLRRHLHFLVELLRELGDRRIIISVEVEQWYRKIHAVLQGNRQLLHESKITDSARGHILEALGRAFSDYRLKVYDDGFSGKHSIGSTGLVEFFRSAIEYLDHAIRANRREDYLYHAYNLLEIQNDSHTASVNHLYEMLEGQVAALSSGVLDAGQAIELIDTLFHSKLYRQDQHSFILYPDRKLPGFLQRNQIPAERMELGKLLQQLVEAKDSTIVVRDALDDYHFCHTIQKQADLEERLNRLVLDDRWSSLVIRDRQYVLDVFEEVFYHKTYTGRSGTMYGYEGLGSIYWHMVSKLLLAIQENVFNAVDYQASKTMIESLADAYYLVRGGLSSDKTPSQYGAFPTDPYSHTPNHSGAQQPGMTGQVKEEIITRQGELGVRIVDGRLRFQTLLLRRREFFEDTADFKYFDLAGNQQLIELLPNSLAFTVCQVPVVYHLSDAPFSIVVTFTDGKRELLLQDYLSAESSRLVFERTGQIVRLEVVIPKNQIHRA